MLIISVGSAKVAPHEVFVKVNVASSTISNTNDFVLNMAIYEADERGELPSDLLRGVLSQDELYNALQAYDEQNG